MMDLENDPHWALLAAPGPFPHQSDCIPVTDIKSIFACAESGIQPIGLVISKPLLRNARLRRIWHDRWRELPTRRLSPARYRQAVAQQPARGLALLAARPRPGWDLLATAGGNWLGLRHLRSPGNLGTLIRSAHALGMHGIVLFGRSLDPFQQAVQRASMGAVWRLPLVHTSHAACADWLRRHRHWQVLAANDDGRLTPEQVDWRGPSIVLLGHERHGLHDADRQLATSTLRIPQVADADSLNVAMAGTVIAAWAGRQRIGQ